MNVDLDPRRRNGEEIVNVIDAAVEAGDQASPWVGDPQGSFFVRQRVM